MSRERRRLLRAVFEDFQSKNLHRTPDIPERKMENALKACSVPQREVVIALLDHTLFGSAKKVTIFTDKGLYSNSVRRFFLTYEEICARPWCGSANDPHEVLVGDCCVDLSALTIGRDDFLTALNEIRTLIAREPGHSIEEDDTTATLLRPSRSDLFVVARQFCPSKDLYLHPNIPLKKIRNLSKSAEVSQTESVVALFDNTVFGSAKEGCLMAVSGLYWKNDWSARSQGACFVPWDQILVQERFPCDGGNVQIKESKWLNLSCCSFTPDRFAELLKVLKRTSRISDRKRRRRDAQGGNTNEGTNEPGERRSQSPGSRGRRASSSQSTGATTGEGYSPQFSRRSTRSNPISASEGGAMNMSDGEDQLLSRASAQDGPVRPQSGTTVGTLGSESRPATGQTTAGSEKDEDEVDKTCCICFEGPKSALLFPCGHQSTCKPCADNLQEGRHRCPICRAQIAAVVTPFIV